MHPDTHTKKAFYALATRYLLGEASSAEREELVRMLREPVWREMFEQMSAGWEASSANWLEGFDVEGEIAKVTRVVAAEHPEKGYKGTPASASVAVTTGMSMAGKDAPRRKSRWHFLTRPKSVLATALSLSLLVALTVYGLVQWIGTGDSQPERRTWVRQVNGVGERMEIALEDGSKVILNADSQLSYPSNFDGRIRVVKLVGEAFFDVSRDTGRPFVVETDTLRIMVLGTQFNVKAFADGTQAKVTLVSGKVQVTPLATSDDTKPADVTLTPGMQYSLSSGGKAELGRAPEQAAIGWMSDRIVWKNEPLADAMRELERRYGVRIEFADPSLAKETVTARFRSESLPEIFAILEDIGLEHRFEPSADNIEKVILSLRQR